MIPGQLQFEFDVPTGGVNPAGLERCVQLGGDYFWQGLAAPRDMFGRCKECLQHYSVGHLGTCSRSIMRSGEVQ